jgi:hypothetical protein
MSDALQSDLGKAALDLQRFCDLREWRFCFIGGIANAQWGQPRYTEDADISLLTGFGEEEPFVDAHLTRFSPRIEHASEFAFKTRVLLLRHENGIGIDVGLAAFPYEEATVSRARFCEFSTDFGALKICGPEDFIIYKAFAGRDHDWGDIAGVLQRQRRLDLNIIRAELPWLLEVKDDEGASMKRLEAMFLKYGHTQ